MLCHELYYQVSWTLSEKMHTVQAKGSISTYFYDWYFATTLYPLANLLLNSGYQSFAVHDLSSFQRTSLTEMLKGKYYAVIINPYIIVMHHFVRLHDVYMV